MAYLCQVIIKQKMKNILFTFALLASVVSIGFAQSPIKDVPQVMETPAEMNGEGPVMNLESMVVDYGTIAQNSEPLRTVGFTNTGTEPLVISNARGSCGCTVPTWPKEPIMPGESCLLYTSPSPRDQRGSRMPSSA